MTLSGLSTVEPVYSGHHGTSISGHHRQVAAVSRSYCTGLVQLGPAVVTIHERRRHVATAGELL